MALFPVASEQPTTRPAVANLTIIALNIFAFLLEISLGDTFIETVAAVAVHLARHPRAGLADAGVVVRGPGHLEWKRYV